MWYVGREVIKFSKKSATFGLVGKMMAMMMIYIYIYPQLYNYIQAVDRFGHIEKASLTRAQNNNGFFTKYDVMAD